MVNSSVHERTSQIALDISPREVRAIFDRQETQEKADFFSRRAVFEVLLDGIDLLPTCQDESQTIWRSEASNRALSLTRLMVQMSSARPHTQVAADVTEADYEFAENLANTYRSLERLSGNKIVACEQTIRHIVRGLLAVFRGTTEFDRLSIRTTSFFLRVEKRRALALLISELVISMLWDGTQRAVNSRLVLSCSRNWNKELYVNVETSCPLSRSFVSPGYEVVCSLAGILEAEVIFSEPRSGGTCVKLVIPF